MEIRHLSKKYHKEAEKYFEDCSKYRESNYDNFPTVSEYYYSSLRDRGNELKGKFKALKEASSTKKSKLDKHLFLEDIGYALNLIEDAYINNNKEEKEILQVRILD